MDLNFQDSNERKFLQVYNYYKKLILDGTLKAGSRLMSIRKASEELAISRTTVESAYLQLAAEGYIISKPQSGYYISSEIPGSSRKEEKKLSRKKDSEKLLYDFTSANPDKSSFQFELWRRYIKSALRQDERLMFYGEPQGEPELREAVSTYLGKNRHVICNPEDVYIGAGVQSLLHILLPRLKNRKRVYFSNSEFTQGRQIFEDYGYETYGVKLSSFILGNSTVWEDMKGSILYFSAVGHHNRSPKEVVRFRMDLLKNSREYDILIIEDDYGSEFRYGNNNIPSLQGLAGGDGVYYLGTFSRMLVPSIRMSYMVVPESESEELRAALKNYNQTASKAEQIALCQFIRDGHLERQIRKSRRLNREKAETLYRIAEEVFGDMVKAYIDNTGMNVVLEVTSDMTPEEVEKKAENAGVAVKTGAVTEENDGRRCRVLLSCTPMKEEDIHNGLARLKEVFVQNI